MTTARFDEASRAAFAACTRSDTERTAEAARAAATACSMAMTAATFAGRDDARKAFATMADEQSRTATERGGASA